MPRPIVELAGIGKRYRVGARREPYLSLRDEIARLASPAAWRERAARTEFWALKEVSLSFQPGEAVGIIGRNGAGKSTLLKLLARITPPSTGSLTLRGRVASLLEVGTGFHPELTGRENITLNGALLGMTRKEIARKFDEIVEFAEIGQFLDTPVKRYSSGMYVRLAFAVAAHLEPEILLVDEVLAVGDAGFQRKCLGKMGDVAGAGRTVLFVSHNMAAVQALCPRAVLIRSGRVEVDGRTDDAVAAHLRLCDPAFSEQAPAPMEKAAGITRVWFRNAFGETVSRATSGSHLELCLSYTAPGNAPAVRVAAVFTDRFGAAVAFCDSQVTGHGLEGCGRAGVAVCTFRRLPLAAGAYTVNVSMNCNEEPVDFIERAAVLDVEPGDFYGSGRAVDARHGAVLTEHTWSVEPSDAPTPAGAGSRSR